jgi:hypothetical protein
MVISIKRRPPRPVMKLFESPAPVIELDTKVLLKIMNDTAYQFHFENGKFMGRVHVPLENKFSLWWHKKNTRNVTEFIDSVGDFLGDRNKLTSNDINNLRKEYNGN